jgi:hypothetical protein
LSVLTFEEAVSKDLDIPLSRRELLAAAKRVLDEALQRLDNRYTKNPDKIKWSRVAVHTISVANSVLRDQDLSELESRIEYLENRLSHQTEDGQRIDLGRFTPEERDLILQARKLMDREGIP